MAGITQKSGVAAFPVWSHQKQNSWIKKSENSMKDFVGISIIAYWRYTRGDRGTRKEKGTFFPV